MTFYLAKKQRPTQTIHPSLFNERFNSFVLGDPCRLRLHSVGFSGQLEDVIHSRSNWYENVVFEADELPTGIEGIRLDDQFVLKVFFFMQSIGSKYGEGSTSLWTGSFNEIALLYRRLVSPDGNLRMHNIDALAGKHSEASRNLPSGTSGVDSFVNKMLRRKPEVYVGIEYSGSHVLAVNGQHQEIIAPVAGTHLPKQVYTRR
jgi:hypothetical protein